MAFMNKGIYTSTRQRETRGESEREGHLLVWPLPLYFPQRASRGGGLQDMWHKKDDPPWHPFLLSTSPLYFFLPFILWQAEN